MVRKFLHVGLLTAVFLASFSKTSFAQINMQQQMPGYSGGSTRSQGHPMASSAALGMVPEDFALLKLAPGFLIGLDVLDDPDFQGSFRIDQDGDIALPFVGALHIAGETVAEARIQIQQKLLNDRVLKDPQVELNVLEYTAPQVTIIGEVTSPGKYPLLAPHKLVEVLALAGGSTIIAGNEVQITSGSPDVQPLLIHYSKSSNPKSVEDVLVHPGDTVQVKRAGIVYVLGAVNRPGGYVMQEDGSINVMQALSLANGTAISASTKTIFVLHRNVDGTEVDIALPYKKMTQGKSADVQLHATDVLYVPTSTMKAVLENSQAVLSSATSASIYAVAAR